MTITVSKQEFCARVAELVLLVEAGDEVVVQEADKPLLKLAAEPSRRKIVFDMHAGAYTSPDFADPLPDEFEAGASRDATAKRIPGLHAGRGWMSDDFDAPLPPEYLPSEE